MTATMAAESVFGRSRKPSAVERDRALLSAAAGLERFTVKDLLRVTSCTSWASAAHNLCRALRAEGHLRVVSPEGSKPYVYEWSEQ